MTNTPTNGAVTTAMQRDHWYRSLRYVPRDRSIIDRVLESPVTFFISLALLCALAIAGVVECLMGGVL